ncbi:unnamed protein product, partial [Polarella glacialis]
MSLQDDDGLLRRKARWEGIAADEHIMSVSGCNSKMGFLAGSIVLHTSRGREIFFEGKRKHKYKGSFTWDAESQHEICDLTFEDGHCTGIQQRPCALAVSAQQPQQQQSQQQQSQQQQSQQQQEQQQQQQQPSAGVCLPQSIELAGSSRRLVLSNNNNQQPPTEKTTANAASMNDSSGDEGIVDLYSEASDVAQASTKVVVAAAVFEVDAETEPAFAVCEVKARTEPAIAESPEALVFSTLPAGGYREAIASVYSKPAWQRHMRPKAQTLEKLFMAEWKIRKTWDYACVVCQQPMGRGAGDHLPGDGHRRKLAEKVSALCPSQDEHASALLAESQREEWLQAFQLLGKRIVLNHLTGEFQPAAAGVGTLDVQLVEAKSSSNNSNSNNVSNSNSDNNNSSSSKASSSSEPAPKKAKVSEDYSAVTVSWRPALEYHEAWKQWMRPFAQQLRAVHQQLCESHETCSFQCAICSDAVDWTDEHLLSLGHYNALWEKHSLMDNMDPVGSLCSQWAQPFESKTGCYLFNHLTGDQGWEDWEERHSESDAKLCDNSSANGGSPLKFSFFAAPALSTAYGYVPDRGQVWGSKPVSGCLSFGWYSGAEWWLRLPRGTYHVSLGLGRRADESPCVNRYSGRVNDRAFSGILGTEWIEVQVPKLEIWDYLCIKGKWPVYYVHIRPASSTDRSTWEEAVDQLTQMQAPPFCTGARGTPKDWNRPDNELADSENVALFWGRKAKESIADVHLAAQPDPGSMLLRFLQTRLGPDGKSLLERLGPPMRQEQGWFSFAWREGPEETAKAGPGKWRRAWHGCKLEALYSIMFHGQLFESSNKHLGDRHFEEMPGVYVHKDKTSHKAENYMRFVPLCGDGVFWAAKWEVRVDRKQGLDELMKKNTDQWVQPARSVRLEALWLCGRSAADMRIGDAVARKWEPELEANPGDTRPEQLGGTVPEQLG